MAVWAGWVVKARAAEQCADADADAGTSAWIVITLAVTAFLFGAPPAIALLSLLGVLR